MKSMAGGLTQGFLTRSCWMKSMAGGLTQGS